MSFALKLSNCGREQFQSYLDSAKYGKETTVKEIVSHMRSTVHRDKGINWFNRLVSTKKNRGCLAERINSAKVLSAAYANCQNLRASWVPSGRGRRGKRRDRIAREGRVNGWRSHNLTSVTCSVACPKKIFFCCQIICRSVLGTCSVPVGVRPITQLHARRHYGEPRYLYLNLPYCHSVITITS